MNQSSGSSPSQAEDGKEGIKAEEIKEVDKADVKTLDAGDSNKASETSTGYQGFYYLSSLNGAFKNQKPKNSKAKIEKSSSLTNPVLKPPNQKAASYKGNDCFGGKHSLPAGKPHGPASSTTKKQALGQYLQALSNLKPEVMEEQKSEMKQPLYSDFLVSLRANRPVNSNLSEASNGSSSQLQSMSFLPLTAEEKKLDSASKGEDSAESIESESEAILNLLLGHKVSLPSAHSSLAKKLGQQAKMKYSSTKPKPQPQTAAGVGAVKSKSMLQKGAEGSCMKTSFSASQNPFKQTSAASTQGQGQEPKLFTSSFFGSQPSSIPSMSWKPTQGPKFSSFHPVTSSNLQTTGDLFSAQPLGQIPEQNPLNYMPYYPMPAVSSLMDVYEEYESHMQDILKNTPVPIMQKQTPLGDQPNAQSQPEPSIYDSLAAKISGLTLDTADFLYSKSGWKDSPKPLASLSKEVQDASWFVWLQMPHEERVIEKNKQALINDLHSSNPHKKWITFVDPPEPVRNPPNWQKGIHWGLPSSVFLMKADGFNTDEIIAHHLIHYPSGKQKEYFDLVSQMHQLEHLNITKKLALKIADLLVLEFQNSIFGDQAAPSPEEPQVSQQLYLF